MVGGRGKRERGGEKDCEGRGKEGNGEGEGMEDRGLGNGGGVGESGGEEFVVEG